MKVSIYKPNIDVKTEESSIDLKLGVQRVNEGTNDYNKLDNHPSINNVELINNKTLHELGIQSEGDYVEKIEGKGLSTNDYTNEDKEKLSTLENYDDTEVRQLINEKQPKGDYALKNEIPTKNSQLQNDSGYITDYIETDPTVPNYVKSITQNNIISWNNKADLSDIPDVSSFITKDANNLTYYELKTNTGSLIDLEINDSTYVVTLKLKNSDGTVISTDTIDLPLETVVVGGSYDSTTKEVVLLLEGGSEVRFSVADLVSGLQSEITSTNKLASDLVDDSNSGNKFVTSSQKTTWNNKYSKPSNGIPKSDLTSDVQTSLGKADTALQSYTETDPTVPNHVKSITQANITSWNNKADAGDIPTVLSDLSDDSTHRLVTDTEKTTWNNKANVSDIPKYYIGTSTTAAATRLKVVECEGFVLEEGATISVTFTNAQTYNGAPQLNVNNTGVIVVQSRADVNGVRYMWSAGEIIDFTYDGTHWVCHGRGFATTSYYGVTKLYTGAGSDSQALASTPRSLYYFANYSIAPYYSASKTYEVGDKVRHNYYLYECTTAIETAEAWDEEHWQQVDTIQEQIDAINTTIGDIDTVLTRLTTGSGV